MNTLQIIGKNNGFWDQISRRRLTPQTKYEKMQKYRKVTTTTQKIQNKNHPLVWPQLYRQQYISFLHHKKQMQICLIQI